MILLKDRYNRFKDYSLSNRNAVIILILTNILFFLPFIIALPDHYLDDFVVFGLIHSRSNNIISLNPSDPYFLFLRPVSYFSFWIDYKLFPMMSILMKLETLLIHLLLVTFVYFLIKELKKYFDLKISNTWIFLLVLVYSIYPDNYKWITWISNRTELLMIFFYVLSLLNAMKYLNREKPHYHLLVLQFLFFLLSILSKQQSLHLPFLFLFLVWYKKEINISRQGLILLFVIALEIVLVIFYSILNASMHEPESLIFIESLWKKPFSLFGNMFIIVNPYYGEIFYNYFLLHKELAIVMAFAIGSLIFFALFKGKKVYPSILVLLIYLVISFPRMFVASGSRVNSIQVLFFIIVAFAFIILHKEEVAKYVVIVFLVLNSFTIFKDYSIDKYYNSTYTKRINKLISIYDENTFMLISKDPLMISCEYYYLMNNEYSYKIMKMAPLLYSELLSYSYAKNIPRIIAWQKNNFISINALSDFVFLSINSGEVMNYQFRLKDLRVNYGKSGRGYSSIEFEIPDEMKGKKIIYHDGIDWRVLTQLN